MVRENFLKGSLVLSAALFIVALTVKVSSADEPVKVDPAIPGYTKFKSKDRAKLEALVLKHKDIKTVDLSKYPSFAPKAENIGPCCPPPEPPAPPD